jgi:plastocyanin
MTRFRSPRATVLALVGAVVLVLAACGGGDDDDAGSTTSTTASTTTEPASSTTSAPAEPVSGDAVTIEDFDFAPKALLVTAGTTVTWTNDDASTHTATGDDGEFDTKSLSPGDSGELTFEEAGTFTYHCEIHPTTMKAEIIVE